MAQQHKAEAQDMLQCVTFNLENEIYGINVMQVQEVLRKVEMAPIPGAPHYITGIINLRGNVVSVINARSRFGLPAVETTSSARIIVVEVQDQVIGILVDEVAEVVDVDYSEIATAPNVGSQESSRYIDGVISRDDKLLILIDLNKLYAESTVADTTVF
ncbi:MAG: chemotaxis protein CheW [Gammaproteobacteria bacterium]|nr:chemotaxis protein CheW [Gammaproteobacteria bacterium]